MPDINPAKSDLVCLTDEILVYRDGEELWRGRAITREEDFYKTGTLTCEGVLAYLYDTYYPPFEFSGSPTDFLAAVLDNHNAQVEERKRIYLGNVTVEDNNDYIARSSIEYNRTLTVLTDKLINDSLGGYFRVRIEGDVKYLDYLASYDTTATQPVAFGENLLDIAQEVEYSDLATVILPLGAKLEDSDGNQTDEYLTIADVNGGSIYYADEAAVAEYGWIVVCNIWEDVTEASNLLTKAKNYLTQVTSAVSSFEVNAVDLALISSEYAPINLGDMVLIQSEPHGVNQYVELTSLTIDLLDPSNDTLTFGADTATLTDSQRSSDRSVQAALESLSVRYTNLVAKAITTDYLTANYITANDIEAKYVTTDTLTANYVKTSYLTANYITASDIAAKYISTDTLAANYITANDIAAKYVTADTLTADYLTASDIEAKYATIDLANVSVESVGTLFADVGLLTSMTVVDGYITGALNGVTISASQLTAGTIDAGTIDVVNLNCANLTVGTINGSQIANGTITTENLSEDITSAITTAQQTADGKNAVYYSATAPSGGTYSVNDIWYDTSNGYAMYYWSGSEWVKAVYGASALSDEVTADIAAALEQAGLVAKALDNLSVGGRNYLPNTRTMDGWSKASNVTLAEDDEGYTVATWAATSTLGWNAINTTNAPIQFSLVRGQSVVLSFDVRSDDYESLNALTNQGLAVTFNLCTADSTTRTLYRFCSLYTTALTDEWQRITVTGTLSDDYFSSGSGDIDDDTRLYIGIFDYSLYSMQVRKVKLELGSTATDWTPAPEDDDESIYLVPVMTHTLEYDGGLKSTITAAGESESQQSAAVSGPVAQQIKELTTKVADTKVLALGKNAVYYAAAAPSADDYTLSVNDLWFDTSGGDYAMYYWDGSKWVAAPFGTSALGDGIITAAKLVAGAVTAEKIDVADLFAQGITATGTISGLTLKGGSININDKFTVDADGNADVSGKITSSEGTIGGFTMTDTKLLSTNTVTAYESDSSDDSEDDDERTGEDYDEGSAIVSAQATQADTVNILSSDCTENDSAFLAVAAPVADDGTYDIADASAYILHDGRAKVASLSCFGNLRAYGDIYTTGGLNTANNCGLWIANTNGTYVKTVWLNANNNIVVGPRNCAYNLYLWGSQIYANNFPIPCIQCGVTTAQLSTASTVEEFTFSFDTNFPGTPWIFLTVGSGTPQNTHVAIRSRSASSCTFAFYRNSTTETNVYWVAIYFAD